MKNDPIYILKAIKYLRPNAEVTILEDDLDTLDWHVVDGDIPTHEEILAAIPVVKKAEEDAVKAHEAKRASAKAKLQDLGLDADEVVALLGA